VASNVLANISRLVAYNRDEETRVCNIGRKRIARVGGAGIVIIAKILGNRVVFATSLRNTTIIGTSVFVIARRGREPDTLGS